MFKRNFIKQNYPVGHKCRVPHPDTNEIEEVEVVNHLLGGFTNTAVVGIVVKHPDGQYQKVEGSYLVEDGRGT